MPFSFPLWCAKEKIPIPNSSLAIWLPLSIFICGEACFLFAAMFRGITVLCGAQRCFRIPGRIDGDPYLWNSPRCPLSLGSPCGSGGQDGSTGSVFWVGTFCEAVGLSCSRTCCNFVRFSCVDRIGIHRTVPKKL